MKTNRLARTLFTTLVSLLMVVTSFSSNATLIQAAPEEPAATLTKTATPVQGLLNTWDMKLRVEVKPKTDTTDVVLVIDRSGSMGELVGTTRKTRMAFAKEAANQFVDTTMGPGVRIALVSYAGETTTDNVFYTSANKASLKTKINALSANEGTFTQQGLRVGHTLLETSTANHKILVLLSDGQPTYGYVPVYPYPADTGSNYTAIIGSGGEKVLTGNQENTFTASNFNYGAARIGTGMVFYSELTNGTNDMRNINFAKTAVAEAGIAKAKGQTIFSIALDAGAVGEISLKGIASKPEYYFQDAGTNLQSAFTAIALQIKQPMIGNIIVTDPMGTGFSLVAGSVVLSPDASHTESPTDQINWKINKFQTIANDSTKMYSEMTYRITTNADIVGLYGNSQVGDAPAFPTNGTTTFTYTPENESAPLYKYNFVIPTVTPTIVRVDKEMVNPKGELVVDPSTDFLFDLAGQGFNEVKNGQVRNLGSTYIWNLNSEGSYKLLETGVVDGHIDEFDVTYQVGDNLTDTLNLAYGSGLHSIKIKNVLKEMSFVPSKTVTDSNGDGLAEAGEVLHYTISVHNTGRRIIRKLSIKDDLAVLKDNIKDFANATYTINGISKPLSELIAGIEVEIPVDGTLDVTFDVIVKDDIDVNIVKALSNIALVGTVPVDTEITTGAPKLNSSKTVLDENGDGKAEAGEWLNYEINLSNTGTVKANQVWIQDDLAGLLPYVDDISLLVVNVNGQDRALNDLVTGFFVDLSINESLKLQFKVKVKTDFNADDIKNLINIATVGKDKPTTSIPTGAPKIVSTKTVKDANLNTFAEAGERLDYTITVKNEGNVFANNILIKDDLALLIPHIDSVVGTNMMINGVVTPIEELMNGVRRDFAPGDTITITFSVMVKTTLNVEVTKVLSNLATVGDENPGTEIPTGAPKLGSDKVVVDANDNGFAEAGEVLTYEISLTNSGEVKAYDVVIKDTLSLLLPYIDSTIDTKFVMKETLYPLSELINGIKVNVEAGETITVKFSVKVISTLNTKLIKSLANLATVGDQTPGTEIPTGAPELYSSKTVVDASGDGIAEPGEMLTYQIIFGNRGNVASEIMTIQDTLSNLIGHVDLNGVTYDMGDGIPRDIQNLITGFEMALGPNDHRFIKFTVKVNDNLDVDVIKTLSNLATIGKQTPGTEIPTGAPKLAAEKTVSDASNDNHAEAGEALTYTITVSNSGTVIKKDLLIQDTLSDLLPYVDDISLVRFKMGEQTHPLQKLIDGFKIDLMANEIATLTFTVNVKKDLDTKEIKVLKNIATVGEDKPETEIPTGAPKLSATKNVVDESKDGFAEANEKLTYTITIKNEGNVTKKNLLVKDNLSKLLPYIKEIDSVKFMMDSQKYPLQKLIDGFNIDIEKDKTITITFIVEVMDNLDTNTIKTLSNLVTVGDLTPEAEIPTGSPKMSSDKVLVDENQNGFAEAGEKLFYEVWVTNSGNVKKEILIKDDLKDLMAYIDSPIAETFTLNGIAYPMAELIAGKLVVIDAGTTSRIRFSVRVKADMKVKDIQILRNIAIVGDDTPEVEIPTGEPKVYSSKSVMDESGDGIAEAGEILTYTILFGNDGTVASEILMVQDTMAEMQNYVDLSNAIVLMDGTTTFNITDLMSGMNMVLGANEHHQISFNVRVKDDLDVKEILKLTNIALLGEDTPEIEIPTGAPVLSSNKTVLDQSGNQFAEAGEQLTYTITFKNSGNVTKKDLLIQDTLSDLLPHIKDITNVNFSMDAETYPLQKLADGFTVDMLAGQTRTIVFTVTLKDNLNTNEVKSLRNLATVGIETPETEIPTGAPVLSSNKTVLDQSGDQFAEAGEQLTYTITFKNSGNVTKKDLLIQDTLSDLLPHIKDITNVNFSMDAETYPLQKLVDGFTVDILAGQTRTIVFTVTLKDNLNTNEVKSLRNLATVGDSTPETEIPTGKPVLTTGKEVKDQNNNGFAEAGETLFYEIWIKNSGNVKSKALMIQDNLSDLLAYIDSPVNGIVTINGIEHPMSDLMNGKKYIVDAGTTTRIRFTVTVKADMKLKDIAVLRNIAIVGDDTPKAEILIGEPRLSSIKIAKDDNGNGYAEAKEMLNYTIEVQNQGNVSALDVMIKDDLALLKDHVEDLTGVMFTMDQEVYPIETLIKGFKVDVGANQTIRITFSVKVKEDIDVKVVSVINNMAYVNDVPLTTETPTEKLNLEVDKEVLDNNGDGVVFPNGILTYNIMIKNNSQSNAYNVKVIDRMNNILYAILDPSDLTLFKVYKGETTQIKVKDLMEGMLVDIEAGETLILYFEVKLRGDLLESDNLLNLVEVDNISATANIPLEVPLVEPGKLPKPATPIKVKPALPATGVSNRMIHNGIQMIAVGLVLMSIEAIRRKRQKAE